MTVAAAESRLANQEAIARAERSGASILGHDGETLYVFAPSLSDELAGDLILCAHWARLRKVYVTTPDGEEILTVCQVLRGGGTA